MPLRAGYLSLNEREGVLIKRGRGFGGVPGRTRFSVLLAWFPALTETILSSSAVATTGSFGAWLTGVPVLTYFATTTTSRIINPTMAILVLLAILFLRLLFAVKALFKKT
jgi:hypothetical protein